MSAETGGANHHVQAGQAEAVKTKSFYDGSNRLTYFVTAAKKAKNGAPALVTKYTYVGVTSRVDVSVEYMTTWNSAWDIAEDTPA